MPSKTSQESPVAQRVLSQVRTSQFQKAKGMAQSLHAAEGPASGFLKRGVRVVTKAATLILYQM